MSNSRKLPEAAARAAGFVNLAPKEAKYDVFSEIFLVRKADDLKSRDSWCRGCNVVFLKAKAENAANHACKCQGIPMQVRERLANEMVSRGSNSAGVINVNQAKKDQTTDFLLAELIAVEFIAIRIVESPSLRKLLLHLDPRYTIPTRRKITTALLSTRASSVRSSGFRELNSTPTKSLTVEFDGWSSRSGLSLMAVVISDRHGKSYLMDLVDITPEKHSAEYLTSKALTSFNASGIQRDKLNFTITDEASNFRKARRQIAQEISKDVLEYRCMAHVLNLIGSKLTSYPIVSRLMSRVSTLITTISTNKRLWMRLKSEGANQVVYSVPTRWYSTGNSIKSIMSLREFFVRIPETEEFSFSRWSSIVNDPEFWVQINHLIVYIERLSEMIGKSERADSRLSSSFRDLINYHKWALESQIDNQFYELANEAFLYHFSKLDLELMLTAYALDPNSKLCYLTEQAIEVIQLFMIKQALLSGAMSGSASNCVQEFNKQYKAVISTLSNPVDDLFDWWSKSPLASLKITGMRLACAHASSANTERIFSALNKFLSPDRNRLSLSTMTDMLTVRIQQLQERKAAVPQAAETSFEESLIEFEENEEVEDFHDAEFMDIEISQGPTAMNQRGLFALYIDFTSNPLSHLEPVIAADSQDAGRLARDLLDRVRSQNNE